MTVCVAVRVNDGIVFAADSASSISLELPGQQPSITNVYRHGIKVFNLFKGAPIAAMTCGLGNFGNASIASLAKDFRFRLGNGGHDWQINEQTYTIKDVVDRAKRYLFDEKFCGLAERPASDFEFWIGGYPAEMEAPYELWKIAFSGGECIDPEQVCKPGETGLSWAGSVAPISRLIVGFDLALVNALHAVLSPQDAEGNPTGEPPLFNELVSHLRGQTESYLSSPMMPIQDAIDLADFLVDATKKFYRFSPGADIVGGETDLAVVTRYEGFKWVSRKHYYSAALNRQGDGHV